MIGHFVHSFLVAVVVVGAFYVAAYLVDGLAGSLRDLWR